MLLTVIIGSVVFAVPVAALLSGRPVATALCGALLIVVLVPFNVVQDWLEVCSYAGILFACVIAIHRARVRLRWTIPVGLLILLVALPVLGTSDASTLPGLALVVLRASSFAALALMLTSTQRRDWWPWIGWISIALLLLMLMFAIVELFITGTSIWPAASQSSATLGQRVNTIAPALPGRALGLSSHPLTFAVSVLLCGLLALQSLQRPFARLAVWILSASLITASGSRSILICLLLAFIIVEVFRPGKYTVLRVLALTFSAGALLAFAEPWRWFGFDAFGQSLSFTQRSAVLESAGALFRRPTINVLLGSGPDSIPDLFALGYLRGDGLQVIDNQFVYEFATSGILGLSLVVLILVALAFSAKDSLSRSLLTCTVVIFFTLDALQYGVGLLFLCLTVGTATPALIDRAVIARRRQRAAELHTHA